MESQESNISREQNAEAPQGLVFSNKAKHDLNQARKWGKFIAVVGFQISGILAISALGNLQALRYGRNGEAGLIFLLIVIGGALIFLPALFLNNFSNQARDASGYNDSIKLENSMKQLFSYVNTRGIIVILYIIFVIYSLLSSGVLSSLF